MNEPIAVDQRGSLEALEGVRTSRDFMRWVRLRLRPILPHAAFLVTLGKLYSTGSVPTHRIGIDYPLNLVEETKNCNGALDDPLLYSWFRTERLRYVDVAKVEEFGAQQQWRKILVEYGMKSMLVHGVLDHSRRRFAVFQVGNPHEGSSQEVAILINSLVRPMSRAAWVTVDSKPTRPVRGLMGHPTLSLTPTELQIVELLAQGLSNKEIARKRGVSDSTVKTQVSRTGAKVGATRRAEIVAIAYPMLTTLPAQTIVSYDD